MSKKWLVPEEKAKRLAVGSIVAGVLVVLFLIVVMVIQFVQLGVAAAEQKRIEQEIEQYERLLEEGKKDLEYYESELGMYHQALQQGWKTP